jgi:hypothetical protein
MRWLRRRPSGWAGESWNIERALLTGDRTRAIYVFMTTLVSTLPDGKEIHRDPTTGLAWAQWVRTFSATAPHTVHHFAHSSAASAAEATLLVTEGRWEPSDRLAVAPSGEHVNLDSFTRWESNPDVHEAVRAACRCGGRHAK